MKVTTLNISLPIDLARFIRDSVNSGAYASASEVIRDGLRLLRRSNERTDAIEEFDRRSVSQALDNLRRLASTQTLGPDLSLRDLIDEGRA